MKKKLFQGIIEEREEKKRFPEDSIREEKIFHNKNKSYKRIYNLNSSGNLLEQNSNEGIKNKKSKMSNKFIKNLESGEIDNLVVFNNDKKILKHPKDKNLNRNIII